MFQTADHRLLARTFLDETLLRILADGPNETIQRPRVGRVRHDSRPVGAPGNPLACVLGIREACQVCDKYWEVNGAQSVLVASRFRSPDRGGPGSLAAVDGGEISVRSGQGRE